MKEMKYWWVGFVIVAVAFLFKALGIPTIVALIISAIVCGVLLLYLSFKKEEVESKYISYNQQTNILHLKKRNFIAGKSLVVKRFYAEQSTYKPAELVYTGMTVGGVSVGETHINEAHYESQGRKTDKYMLYYKDIGMIEKITCDFEIPSDSAVSKFCSGKKTVRIMPPKSKSKMDSSEKQRLANAILSGDKTSESCQISSFLEQKLLSKEDCNTIKSWVSGEID